MGVSSYTGEGTQWHGKTTDPTTCQPESGNNAYNETGTNAPPDNGTVNDAQKQHASKQRTSNNGSQAKQPPSTWYEHSATGTITGKPKPRQKQQEQKQ